MQLHPEFIERMEKELGDQAAAFFSTYKEESWVGLRANVRKGYVSGFEGVPWCPSGSYVPKGVRMGKDPLHAAGAYYMQEPSAMAPVEAMGVVPGMRVLDLCAAPGGKSTQIADKLMGEGILVTNEIHPTRSRILLENIERMGVRNAVVLNETPARIATHFGAWFDAVLVDAPCSGEGMFRRDEIAVEQWTPDAPQMCHERQMEILECAAKCLKGGGVLVYSTCTYNKVENEETIACFLEAHPEFRLDEGLHMEGIPCKGGMAHLYPHQLRGEGHFLARLIKTGSEENELPNIKGEKPDARWTKFEKESLNVPFGGELMTQGEWLYALPEDMPVVKGLKVLRAGVQLGKLASGRLEPAHALALAVNVSEVKNSVSVEKEDALRYLHGETLQGNFKGWGLILHKGFSLGWGKCSDEQVKNHFPKGLRWK